jgi:phosphatidate cytidylyltransferase
MKDVVVRALSGAVFVLLMLGAIYLNAFAAATLFGLLVAIGLLEFARLTNKIEGVFIPKRSFILLGTLLYLLLLLHLWGEDIFQVLALPFILLLLISYLVSSLFWKSKMVVVSIGTAIFGICYVVVPFFFLVLILDMGGEGSGWKLLFMLFIIIWSNDTFAYLTGRIFGKTKLMERISPKKTWEGTIGGLLFAISAGVILGVFWIEENGWYWAILAGLLAVAAITGDLFESMLKRTAGMKDSGNIMPGHGGVLDRFDAVLFGAPVFFAIRLLIENWN